jgi:WD40 repeat protein
MAPWFPAVLLLPFLQPPVNEPTANQAPPAPAAQAAPEERLELKPSPLNQLDPAAIPPEERCAETPPDVVALIGSQRGRYWRGWRSRGVNFAWSPDLQLLVTAGEDGIRVRDATTLREVAALKDCKNPPRALAFNRAGDRLAVWDEHVWVWERKGKSFRCLTREGNPIGSDNHRPAALAFSPDGIKLAEAIGGWVQLWDMTDGTVREVAWLRTDVLSILSLAFSPDGRKLAVANDLSSGARHSLELWDVSEEPRPEAPTEGSPSSAVGSPSSAVIGILAAALLVLAALYYGNRRWSSSQKRDYAVPPRRIDGATARTAVLIGLAVPIGLSLICCLVVRVMAPARQPSPDTPRYARKVGFPSGTVMDSLAFTDDGRTLLTVGLNFKVYHWDVGSPTPTLKAELGGGIKEAPVLALAPDGQTLATGNSDGTVCLWDLRASEPRQKVLRRGRAGGVSAMAFSPDGRTLATRSSDILPWWDPIERVDTGGTLHLWDLTGEVPIEKAARQGLFILPGSLAFSADGATLAAECADRSVRLWDLSGKAPEERYVIRGLPDFPRTLALAPDAQMLAMLFVDGSVLLWRLGGGEPRRWAVIPELKAGEKDVKQESLAVDPRDRAGDRPVLRFSPDGRFLLACRTQVQVWDLRGDAPRERVDLRSTPSLAQFSADGRMLALYTKWHLVDEEFAGTLWDLSNDNLEKRARFPARPRADGFVLNDQTLTSVTVQRDGAANVRLWDLKSNARKKQIDLEQAHEFLGHVFHGFNDYPKQRWGRWEFETREDFPVTLAPDGTTVAAVDKSSTVVIWSAGTGKKLREIRVPWVGPGGHTVSSSGHLLHAPDGRHVALWNHNGTVYILRLADDGKRPLRACYERGLAHVRERDFARAIDDFTEVIRLDPSHARAYEQRGLAYAEQGKYDRAKADLERAFQLDPKLAEKK